MKLLATLKDGEWWELQGDLFGDSHSSPFSQTLPRSGMTRDGSLFGLPTPAHPTVAPVSSSLPTPHAGLGERGRDGVYPNPRGQQDLQHAISHLLLPTPTVIDMGSNYTPDEWEAWKAKQKVNHGNGNGHGASLTQEAISLLPTPATVNGKSTRAMTASTDNGRRSGGGQSSPPGLEEVTSIISGHWPDHMPPPESLPPATVALLPTPTVQQGRNATSGRQPDAVFNTGTTLQDLVFDGTLSTGASTSPPSGGGNGPSTAPHQTPLFPAPTDDHDSHLCSSNG
jgi:hypothetical protein